MMSVYEFEIILKRIYKNRLIYLFFVIEISLGMSILFFSLNHLLSYKKTVDRIDSMMMPYETRLEVVGYGDDDTAMSLEDYRYISNKYKDNVDIYLISNHSIEYRGKLENCKIVFCDFSRAVGGEYHLGKDKEKEDIKFILDIRGVRDTFNIKIYSDEYSMGLKKGRIEYEGREYRFINKDGIKIRDLYVQEYENIGQEENAIDHNIFVDISLLKDSTKFTPTGIRFFLSDRGLRNVEEVKYEISQYLKSKHPDYEYRFKNDLGDFNTNNRSDLIYMYVYAFISVVIILLFLITFTGVFKILTKKRERDLAVNLAFGGNRYRLVVSMLIENYSVIFLGTFIGILCGIKINSVLTTDLFRKYIHPELVFLLFGLSVLMSFVSSIGSILRLTKMEVVDIIKS